MGVEGGGKGGLSSVLRACEVDFGSPVEPKLMINVLRGKDGAVYHSVGRGRPAPSYTPVRLFCPGPGKTTALNNKGGRVPSSLSPSFMTPWLKRAPARHDQDR